MCNCLRFSLFRAYLLKCENKQACCYLTKCSNILRNWRLFENKELSNKVKQSFVICFLIGGSRDRDLKLWMHCSKTNSKRETKRTGTNRVYTWLILEYNCKRLLIEKIWNMQWRLTEARHEWQNLHRGVCFCNVKFNVFLSGEADPRSDPRQVKLDMIQFSIF